MKATATAAFLGILLMGTVMTPASAETPQPPTDLPAIRAQIQKDIGGINPKLADLTTEILYADIWDRPELSKRDRSLITVTALIALNRPEQLRFHLVRARQNGLTEEELIETITHLAFYSGWPTALNATAVAKEVFREK